MVVATRNFTQGRNGSFNGGETSTLTPQINSEGHIVFDTSSTGRTGTRSGGQSTTDVRSVYEIYNGTVQTSGNLYSLTDSGESPPGGGSSINYLLPSTDFADDPAHEQDASLSSGGLGYFASAFGFRGGIVGATFATALPGNPSLPGSTTFGDDWFETGEVAFLATQDPLDQIKGLTCAVPDHRWRKAGELMDKGMPALLDFAENHPEIFGKFVEKYGQKGVERLVTVLSWGYHIDFQNFASFKTWAVRTEGSVSTLTIDSNSSWWPGEDSFDRQAYILDYALQSAIDGKRVEPPKGYERVGTLTVGDMVTWHGMSTHEALRNAKHKSLWMLQEVGENAVAEVALDLAGHGFVKCISVAATNTGIVILAVIVKNVDDASIRAADPKAVVNALCGWNSRKFFVNGQNLLLDKSGLKHILERHHPSFWNGTTKASQSFFPKNMSVSEIEHAITEVLKQNPTRIGEIGANGIGQMTGVVNGVRYQLGLNRGRIGQFFPILD